MTHLRATVTTAGVFGTLLPGDPAAIICLLIGVRGVCVRGWFLRPL